MKKPVACPEKPAAAASNTEEIPDDFVPLATQCVACGGNLTNTGDAVMAVCYDLIGTETVAAHHQQCTATSCRLTHCHNYYVEDGQKVNYVNADQIQSGVLFVNNKRCFTVRFLKYHLNLASRGNLCTKAVAFAYEDMFQGDEGVAYGQDVSVNFNKQCNDAFFYYLVVQEIGTLKPDFKIVVGEELSEDIVEAYSDHLHKNVFPPSSKAAVKEVVGDGHAKITFRCDGATGRGAGRPRKLK